jgi:hypothetical protein
MKSTHVYDVINKVHLSPQMCFEYWILSGAGIIPDTAEARQETNPSRTSE